jgi:hypothetical protein
VVSRAAFIAGEEWARRRNWEMREKRKREHMTGLSKDVGEACDRWLEKKGDADGEAEKKK